MINQPKCAKCGSTKFALIELRKRFIENLDKSNNPINFTKEEIQYSAIKCCKCQTLLERKK